MRRVFLAVIPVVALAIAGGAARPALAGGQEEDPGPVATTVPVDDAGPETPLPTTPTPTTRPGGTTLPTLPPECEPPPAPAVVFVGRLDAAAGGVGRFAVLAVRSDPMGRLSVGEPVDVRIGDDLRFLVYDGTYLVAAEEDGAGRLQSKVRQPEPLFGGDQVVGIDDFGVQCPALADPIVVRRSDGGSVDTGVFSGFFDDKRGIAFSFAKPAAAVAGVLVGLWMLKWFLIGLGKGTARCWRWVRRVRDARARRRSLPATTAH